MNEYKTENNDYQKNLFQKLKKNLEFEKGSSAFAKYMGKSVWFISTHKIHDRALKQCKVCGADAEIRKRCTANLANVLKKSQKSRRTEKFVCPRALHGFCYPIYQGNTCYGFVIMCGLKQEVSDKLLQFFATFVDAVVKETQKGMELKKLYETMRPRAIALSTVHTVYRLISSTLDLNELLPRIARLSLQILRANRCSIKLVDSKKKILLPKATIDLRTKKARLKKVKIGMYAPGKAVKYTKSIRGRDYLATPFIDEDAIGVITVYDKIDNKPFTQFDEDIMRTLAEQAVIAIKNAQLYKEQEMLTSGGIKSLAALLEMLAPGVYTPKASFLKIVQLIGQEFKMSEPELKSLQYATILHDAGQIVVPDKVLKKKGGLTGKEFKIVKEHPMRGVSIIKPFKALKSVVPTILHHHENYDGTGYPKGRKGNEIPLSARIMAVVGAFEAMITKKPYRTPLTIPQAVAEIKASSGTQFDPRVVEVFLKLIKRRDVRRMLRKEKYGIRS